MAQMKMTLASLTKFRGVSQLLGSPSAMRGCFAARPSSSSSDQRSPPEGSGAGTDDSASRYHSRVVQFSSSRSRDYMGEAETLRSDDDTTGSGQQRSEMAGSAEDGHVDSYDAHGSVNLSSHMQTNVPEPFVATGASKASPSHVNMPGGHVMQGQRYLSDERQQVRQQAQHYGAQQKIGSDGGTKKYSTMAAGRVA